MTKKKTNAYYYIPMTPGGTYLDHLKSKTKELAIKKLLKETAHMPYGSWEAMKERGYTIEVFIKLDTIEEWENKNNK